MRQTSIIGLGRVWCIARQMQPLNAQAITGSKNCPNIVGAANIVRYNYQGHTGSISGALAYYLIHFRLMLCYNKTYERSRFTG